MRMTIVRHGEGHLWIHSPMPIDDALADKLAQLGTVQDIVAPNRFHHRFATAAKRRYVDATLWAAPGLPQKRKAVPFDATLSEDLTWGTALQTLFIRGIPMWSEHVFFHPASRTLICTDLLFNIHDEPEVATRLLYRALGIWRRFGSNRLWRWLATDRVALDACIQRILAWPLRRIVMAHGDVAEIEDPEHLLSAFDQLRLERR